MSREKTHDEKPNALGLRDKEANLLKALKNRVSQNSPWLMKIVIYILVWAVAAMALPPRLNATSVTEGAQRFVLDNGFTVILKEDHSFPVAAIQVWVKTGSANETDEEAGITHLIEHMIFKGTPTRKTGEIARTIESSGGHINAYTTLDRTVYYVDIASRHFHTALDVLLDAVQHSLFDSLEVEREKEVVLEEYRRSLDIPHTRLSWSIMSLCYEKHPYGRPIIGRESTIRTFDRQAILNYMDKWYTPHNMVLVAIGDFDINQALTRIQPFVKDFPKRTGIKPSRPVEPEQTFLRKILLNDQVQQIYLDMSWHIPHLTHEDMPALDLLEITLGHGKSSRLYGRLKMEKNLVYSIDAGAYALKDPGLFSIDATLSTEKLNSALEAIAGEIIKISDKPISELELSKAKTIAEADFVFAMESISGQARTLGFFETMTGDMHQADTYLERIMRITSKDILHVARTYLRPQNLSLGIMAPRGSNLALSNEQITDLFTQARNSSLRKEKMPSKEPGRTTKVVLSNGMRIIIKENHRLPVVSLIGAFIGGSRLESTEHWGISGFVSKMLTRGTTERSAADIALTVESWAGTLEGFSGRNSFGISAKFLTKDLYPGLALLADVVLNPIFPQSELGKAREDILAAIRAKKDNPLPQVFDLFYKTLFKHHPYGHPLTGTEKTIQSVTRADLVKWHRAFATSSHFVLAVVGDINKDEVIPYINTLFHKMNPAPKQLPSVAPEPRLPETRKAHLERAGAQTHLAIGYLGADFKSKDNPPMALIETSLSGQGGRLFFQLRDKESLAYSVTAFRRPGLETGVFGVYLACDPKKLSVAKKALLRELEKVRSEGLTQTELEEAKKYLLGNLQIENQTNASQAMQMALDELYGLGYDHLQRYIEDIERVSTEDIREAARNIILPGEFVSVTVGPGTRFE
jgi:zinc protease